MIGHPHGLEFSITRGVTSAVRKMPNKAILPGAGDVLLVQSDAAVNRGNSGGPWFVNNEVVAVTSWGFSSANAQNINFGIHYSEAQRFLKESLGRSE